MSRRWLVHYYPGAGREYVVEGDKRDLDAWFYENHVCGHCKQDMKGGAQEVEVWIGGQMIGTQATSEEPYDDPWATPCGCEYGYEEMA